MLNKIEGQAATLKLVGALAIVASTINVSIPAVNSQTENTIKIDGSSTVFPITEAVAEEFQKSKQGVRVTVGISGTGGGMKKFCNNELDIADASRPISTKEIDACKKAGVRYIELPIAYDAITVVVNKRNTALDSITVADLKKIWEPAAQDKIKNWKDLGDSYPDAPLKLYGPGAQSGTFDYFTEAIVGKKGSSRTDYTASEDDNVLVQGVSKNRGAIGYFGYAYYDANRSRLKALKINGVEPSEASVKNGTYTPLSRPLFIYVNAKAVERSEVKSFVDYYLNNASKAVAEVKYIAFPASGYTNVKKHFADRKLGTKFNGKEPVGLSFEAMLKLEAKE